MSLVTRLTYVLPHRLLSSRARSLAYSQNPRISRWLIDTVTAKFNVNLAEAANPDPRSYPSFNAFFTRALKPGARVVEQGAGFLGEGDKVRVVSANAKPASATP